MAEPARTRPVSAAQVRAYAAKAQEFAEAAASDIEAGRNIAATSLAIHSDHGEKRGVERLEVGRRRRGGAGPEGPKRHAFRRFGYRTGDRTPQPEPDPKP